MCTQHSSSVDHGTQRMERTPTSMTPRGMESCSNIHHRLEAVQVKQSQRELGSEERTGVTMSDLNQKILPCLSTNHLYHDVCLLSELLWAA